MAKAKNIAAGFLAVVLALTTWAGAKTSAKKKKKKHAKPYAYDSSKYKAYGDRVDPKTVYRYDEKGNPVVAGAHKPKKKQAHHKKSSHKQTSAEVAQGSP